MIRPGIKQESIGTLLLPDVRDIFERRDVDRMFTRQMVGALIGLPERPWSELRRDKPISDTWLPKVAPGGNVTLLNDTNSACDVSENPIPPSNDAACDAVTGNPPIPGPQQETFL